jgi:hypothetical protein
MRRTFYNGLAMIVVALGGILLNTNNARASSCDQGEELCWACDNQDPQNPVCDYCCVPLGFCCAYSLSRGCQILMC